MAFIKDWTWGREGVTLYDDHITWYEKEGAVRFASGGACDQSFESFLQRGAWVEGAPPEITAELTQAVRDHVAKRRALAKFKSTYSISGDDLSALPVKAIGPAVAYYQSVLGFSVVASDETTAILQRDEARIGLVAKPAHEPEEAGSFPITVTDLDAMRSELDGRGLDLGAIRVDEWGGRKHRVCFLREFENGYCYCFTQPLAQG
ncbi:VOC family protein [Zavarzinella formosa]|uniref:hypothetical protein n=1 Tax=Zavarzinella formosa TaxID=360055 RepID=UPI0002D96673|nr:hypothetical protein [Zavarzinella formosa]